MKNNNIIIFSSGFSEQSGLLADLQNQLSKRGYHCSVWRNLFEHANDINNIALLPMLIKKIPTFDYAVLICEGHDLTTIVRGNQTVQVKTMRDNVLFEIGLCSMALGLNRTILLTDKDVRLPDDLTGKHNSIALKRITLTDTSMTSIENVASEIDQYILDTGDVLQQIIIGAASSIACGYIVNFVSRVLEHIEDEIELKTKNGIQRIRVSPQHVYLEIRLPDIITPEIITQIKKDLSHFSEGCLSTARNRPIYFTCEYANGNLHIIDSPTSIVTSYDTAKIILNMDADDSMDLNAAHRFTTKELNLFESTLHSLLTREFISQVIDEHYHSAEINKREHMINIIMDVLTHRLSIKRVSYETS